MATKLVSFDIVCAIVAIRNGSSAKWHIAEADAIEISSGISGIEALSGNVDVHASPNNESTSDNGIDIKCANVYALTITMKRKICFKEMLALLNEKMVLFQALGDCYSLCDW